MMYGGIIAGMAQQEAAQLAAEAQRRAWEDQAAYRAMGQESLAKLLERSPGGGTWSGTPTYTTQHCFSSSEPGPKRYKAISCRSCGAPVTSIEPACTYCLTER